MRQGPSNRRARGRGTNSGGRRGNLPNRNQTFDSNGPDVRIRGTAFQVNEKYQALARDATASGDRIMAENYLQHAEHYHRIIASINEAHTQSQQQPDGRDGAHRHRGNGHRDNGHRDDGPADRVGAVAAAAAEAGDAVAADAVPEVEFGKDPRQDDVRDASSDLPNGEAVADTVGSQPSPEPDKPASEASKGNGADTDGDGDEAPPPRPRRRGPGRPRKSTTAKSSTTSAPEANTDGD